MAGADPLRRGRARKQGSGTLPGAGQAGRADGSGGRLALPRRWRLWRCRSPPTGSAGTAKRARWRGSIASRCCSAFPRRRSASCGCSIALLRSHGSSRRSPPCGSPAWRRSGSWTGRSGHCSSSASCSRACKAVTLGWMAWREFRQTGPWRDIQRAARQRLVALSRDLGLHPRRERHASHPQEYAGIRSAGRRVDHRAGGRRHLPARPKIHDDGHESRRDDAADRFPRSRPAVGAAGYWPFVTTIRHVEAGHDRLWPGAGRDYRPRRRQDHRRHRGIEVRGRRQSADRPVHRRACCSWRAARSGRGWRRWGCRSG